MMPTPDMLAEPFSLLNGVPFLDERFRHSTLLAAVAAGRYHVALQSGHHHPRPPQAWLWPSAALMLRNGPPMPVQPLTPVRLAAVTASLEKIGNLLPEWVPLLALPVRYALLSPSRGAISASSRMWPQHVLLAEAAFVSERELREQLVHELCHQWLYLVQELWTLADPQAEEVTLPSGTPGRAPDEVLGAAHVAAALIRLYRASCDGPRGRIEHLIGYGNACLESAHGLTDAGTRLAERLGAALNGLEERSS